jgi:protein-disulfide isomerase
MTFCLLAVTAAGCKAQTLPLPAASAPLDQQTVRKIEVLVRQKLKVPTEYAVTVGGRTPSSIPGFDTVRITFSSPTRPDHSQTISFLLTKDGNTLARLSEWNIDAASAIPAANRPVRGNPDAKVVIVNYDDLECPYCAKMHAELFPNTLDHYKGLIKVVYHDLPLEELHPWAMHAAVDANCLGAQSTPAYWSYVDYIHVHGQDVSGPDRDLAKAKATLDKLATDQGTKAGVDAAKLSTCIAKQDETEIRAEMQQAESLGVASTPTLYINGEEMEGALDVDTLWSVVDRALVSEGVTPPASAKPDPVKPEQPKPSAK